MGLYQNLKLVEATCQCPVETKHAMTCLGEWQLFPICIYSAGSSTTAYLLLPYEAAISSQACLAQGEESCLCAVWWLLS